MITWVRRARPEKSVTLTEASTNLSLKGSELTLAIISVIEISATRLGE